MRVLFVSGLTGFVAGGVQTEMVRLIGGARDRGVDVAFAVDQLPVRLTDVRHFPVDYPPSNRVGEQIRAAVNAFAPDCVHVVGGGRNVLRPMDELRLDVPWVFTAHNLPPYERISAYFPGYDRLHYGVRNARAWPTVRSWKRLLRGGNFARVIAHSQGVAGHLVDYGCPPEKVVTIPFGCDPPSAAASTADSPFPRDAYPKVLTVAGFAYHKGIHDYLAAVAPLVKRFPKLVYRVVGNSRNPQYLRFLHSQINALGLARHVALLQNASDAVKHAALADADLYVQPSHEEGFCLAFAEAVMVAQRLIGSRTGEIAGLAGDDPTTRLVEPKDLAGLVTMTKALMAVHVTAADIAARAGRLLQRYPWTHYLDRHLDLFSHPALGEASTRTSPVPSPAPAR